MGEIQRMRWVQPVLDVVVALFVTALPIASVLFDDEDSSALVPTIVLSVLIGLTLVFRRRAPIVVLGVVLATAVPSLLSDGPVLAIAAGAVVALYTIASQSVRRTTIIATAVSAATIVGLMAVQSTGPWPTDDAIPAVVWLALAAAVGDAVRSRRSYVRVLQDRAVRAEETREQMALARVTEERLRIAQELHDIVAHHIAVVNIQAGLASRAMSKEAYGTAATAVDRVSEAARSALDDLSAVLRLLRASDDVGRREPAPGLGQVGDLIQSYAHADHRIRWSMRGQTVSLDAASELTAYRVIQEALTNATKHGVPGGTYLTVSWESAGLVITVSNPVGNDPEGNAAAPVGTGFGMIGLHERVASIGGHISAGRQPGGPFVVRAMIPYSPPRQSGKEQTP